MKKVLSIFLLVVLLTSVFCINPVLANDDKNGKDSKTATSGALSVLDNFNGDTSAIEGTGIVNIAQKIVGAIQYISIIATVILVAVFGFQFIMGSAEQKSDYQKKFIPLIVGVVVVFAATTIARLLINNFSNIA